MADPGLIAAVVANGIERDDAEDMVNRVVEAIVERVAAGKVVRLEGVGQLRAPMKPTKVGFPPNHLREQRKIELRHGAVIEAGEPYANPNGPRQRTSTYGRG